MVTNDSFRKLALSFPGVIELPHFDKASFRIKKKIFASLAENERIATIKLATDDQRNFCAMDENIIFPVPNKWAQQGWTFINLKNIGAELLNEVMRLAFIEVSKKNSQKSLADKSATP